MYSFRGLTCLLQLSTASTNYIIDPLDMFSEMHILNKITTNADILKVLHNAEMDVYWLQVSGGLLLVSSYIPACA